MRHGDVKGEITTCGGIRAVGYAIGETVARVATACMHISDFAISNILMGKDIVHLKSHTVLC